MIFVDVSCADIFVVLAPVHFTQIWLQQLTGHQVHHASKAEVTCNLSWVTIMWKLLFQMPECNK